MRKKSKVAAKKSGVPVKLKTKSSPRKKAKKTSAKRSGKLKFSKKYLKDLSGLVLSDFELIGVWAGGGRSSVPCTAGGGCCSVTQC